MTVNYGVKRKKEKKKIATSSKFRRGEGGNKPLLLSMYYKLCYSYSQGLYLFRQPILRQANSAFYIRLKNIKGSENQSLTRILQLTFWTLGQCKLEYEMYP